MPLGGVLLRPKDGSHLKDPLEHPHHGLLVELGGLGQEGLAAEVVQAEDVAAALGPGVDNLGGVNFGEALSGEVLPEGPAQPRLDAEHRPLPLGPQHHRPQGQLGVQAQVQLPLGHGHRHGGRRTGENLHALHRQLPAAGGPLLGTHQAGYPDGALLAKPLRLNLRRAHTLQKSVGHAQGQKGDAAQAAQGMDRAVDRDLPSIQFPGGHHPGAYLLFGTSNYKFHHNQPFLSGLVIRPGQTKSPGCIKNNTPRDEIIVSMIPRYHPRCSSNKKPLSSPGNVGKTDSPQMEEISLRTVSSEVLRSPVSPNQAFSTVARSLCWMPWGAVFVSAV